MALLRNLLLIVCTALVLSGVFLFPVSADAADAWMDTTFSSRRKITFNNGSSSEDLSNFPVAVILTSSTVDYSKTQSSGQDLRFTDSNGTTTLSHEIEKWDESGTSTVWVKVPTINGTSSADYIYLYYGSSTATSTASSSAVWESAFAGVWHLSESPSSSAPQAQDSTSNNRDGRSGGSMTLSDRVNGPNLDGAWDFDGSDDVMQVTSTSALNAFPLTLTIWTKLGSAANNAHIVNKYISSSGNGYILAFSTASSASVYAYYYGASGNIPAASNLAGGTISTSTWIQLGLVVDSTSGRLYYNGTLIDTKSWVSTPSAPTTSENLKITCYPQSANCTGVTSGYLGALVDELRVASSSRSVSWLRADYLSGSNQFNTFDAEEGVPTIQFSTSSSSGSESVATATLTLTLSATTSQAVTVQYSVQASSTATGSGADYTLAAGTSTVTAGSTSTSISIPIVNDGLVESSETIVVRISTSTNALLATTTEYVYTILDDDVPTVTFASTSASSSESTATATITLELTATSSNDIVLTFSTSGTATSTADYTLSTTTATISAGNTTTSFSFTIVNDSLDEADETVILTIATSTNSTIGSTSTLTYTIQDDDSAPTIQFQSATSSNSEASTSISIIISLSASSSFITTVQYSVQTSSTATSTADYTLANGTGTISAGNTTTSISVSIANDSSDENDETIVLQLSNPASSTLGSNIQHIYTITDDDSAPAIGFVSSTAGGSESTATATVNLILSASSSFTITVQYAATGGTAANDTDYVLSSGTSTIQAGNTTTSISISVVNDSTSESDETIIVTLSTPVSATTTGATSTFTYTIQDNDSSDTTAPSVSSVSASAQSTQATITWTTDESASSIVTYGISENSLTSQTAETDTSPRVTSHSVTLSSLTTCQSYYYKVSGSDASGNISTSSVSSFRTSGCSTGGGGSAPSSIQGRLSGVLPTTPTPIQSQAPAKPENPSLPPRSLETGSPNFPRSLKLGDIGEDVKRLQVFLNQNGFPVAPAGPGSRGQETTKFGALTKLALLKFQEANKKELAIPEGTGTLGPKTLAFLNTSRQKTQAPVTVSPKLVEVPKLEKQEPKSEPKLAQNLFQRSLREGMSGDDVRLLQELLAKNKNIYPEGIISGYFGPKTTEAVKRFQLAYQITTSDNIAWGYVGPKTRMLLHVLVKGE